MHGVSALQDMLASGLDGTQIASSDMQSELRRDDGHMSLFFRNHDVSAGWKMEAPSVEFDDSGMKQQANGYVQLAHGTVYSTDLGRANDYTTPRHKRSSRRGPAASLLRRFREIEQRSSSRSEQKTRIDEETEWLAIHRTQYPGQWIALSGSQLLIASLDPKDVIRFVRGIQPKPLVMQIDANDVPFGGW